jgi:D-sedoheptulose 7-phosphate isomerase
MKDTIIETIKAHKNLIETFQTTQVDKVIAAANMLITCFNDEKCVFLCGNGGSAADAQHIAGEFVGRFRTDRKPLPAVALTTDTSVITCIGNDFGFDDIFARQLEALAKPSDILWAFSTSGTSKNVLKAAETAKKNKVRIIAFTGKSRTPLEELADVCLAVDAPNTAAAQEIHQLAYHIICDLIDKSMIR